ncbi:hypothetical protein E4U32_002561 [Claviceps aff. humidiphila group G2b]|nr:hypothetical protein E4U32_002561 [Claviceps aff. humidiphila group G2b]
MTPRAVSRVARVARVARDFGTPKLRDEDCELRPAPDLNAHWLKLKRLRVDDPKRYLATVFGNEKHNWIELCDSILIPWSFQPVAFCLAARDRARLFDSSGLVGLHDIGVKDRSFATEGFDENVNDEDPQTLLMEKLSTPSVNIDNEEPDDLNNHISIEPYRKGSPSGVRYFSSEARRN